MLTWFKDQFTPKVKAYNVERSFVVNGVSPWRLCNQISQIPGVVFARRPWLLGSSAKPSGQFTFRGIHFQVDDVGDTGGDGLWVTPEDELPHPAELREIREHLDQSLAQ
jgi:hypothetical protein